MPLFHEMTDQDLVASARRCQQPTYHALADRIEQRSADTLALVNVVHSLLQKRDEMDKLINHLKAAQLLERLEESGTIDKLKRVGGR